VSRRRFAGAYDGGTPECALVYYKGKFNGKFYGTTAYGGKLGGGTVFSISP
jgi:uncharacterized repeat protein (TIGR03803 family)